MHLTLHIHGIQFLETFIENYNIYRELNKPVIVPRTWYELLTLILTSSLEIDTLVLTTLQMGKMNLEEVC